MKKLNKKGFMLVELLAVSVVIMVIFAAIYINFFPAMGEYEKRLEYNDINAQYSAFYMRVLYLKMFDENNTIQDNFLNQLNESTYISLIENGVCNDIFSTVNGFKTTCDDLATNLGIEEMIFASYETNDLKNTYMGNMKEYINYLSNYTTEDDHYRLIAKTVDGYATTKFYSKTCGWGDWTLNSCDTESNNCESGTVYINLGEWTNTACDITDSLCEIVTQYRKKETEQVSWGEWTTTPCDTSNSETCETSEVKRSRGYAGIGKYTGTTYCPTQTYGYFKDTSNIGSICYWYRWKKTCQLTKSGYESCAGSEITYHTTQNTACVGSRSTICYNTVTGGEMLGYPGIVAYYTYDSANSGWVDRSPSYTAKSVANSCGTVGTTTLTESGNTYVLKSKGNTYQCYKYTGNYGAYSEGACTNTYCLLGVDGIAKGTCCENATGYRVGTPTYGDWGEWTTTPCDTGNSDACESKIQYRLNTMRENPIEVCSSSGCESRTGYRTKGNTAEDLLNYSVLKCN